VAIYQINIVVAIYQINILSYVVAIYQINIVLCCGNIPDKYCPMLWQYTR
jgi:hypothetical protein